MRLHAHLLERQERHQRRPQHLQHAIRIPQMLLDYTIRTTKRPHAHLPRVVLPCVQHRGHGRVVVRIGSVEAETSEVGSDEVALGGLVEHEFQHLRPVVGRAPGVEGFGESVAGHEPGFLLVQQVRVCGCDGHEVDFRVELCLEGRGEGDVEGGGVGGAVAFGGGGGAG